MKSKLNIVLLFNIIFLFNLINCHQQPRLFKCVHSNEDENKPIHIKGIELTDKQKEEQKRYLVNSYRVLLTRARQGMIIFVPRGVDPEEDSTRDSKYYDGIYNYLVSCGIKEVY